MSRMSPVRAYALRCVEDALLEEIPQAHLAELQARAAGLVAIAEANGLPVETLCAWIHEPADEKEWSLEEFENFCRAVGGVER
jgi:hypothetical protein